MNSIDENELWPSSRATQSIRYEKTWKPVAQEMKHNYKKKKKMHKINITGLSCVRKAKRQREKIFINIGTKAWYTRPPSWKRKKDFFYRFVGLNATFTGLCSGLKGLSAAKKRKDKSRKVQMWNECVTLKRSQHIGLWIICLPFDSAIKKLFANACLQLPWERSGYR